MSSCFGDVGDDGVERALVIVTKEHPANRNAVYAVRQRRAIVGIMFALIDRLID